MAKARRVAKKKPPRVDCEPGVVYKPSRDRLYVFDRKEIVVISGGQTPQAWRKTAERGWCAARPAIPHYTVHLSLPEAEESPLWHLQDGLVERGGQRLFPFIEDVRDACFGHRAWVAWLRGVDLASRRAAVPFWDRHWHLMTLAMRCPGATDLMKSNPALGFALASSWVFRGEERVQRPLRSARALVRKRQRWIAEWLKFPGTESAVRMLRRMPHSAINIGSLLRLRRAMYDDSLNRTLRHVPWMTYDVIRICSSDELVRHTLPRLLIEAGSQPEPQQTEVWKTMRDTFAMLRQMDQEPDGLTFRSREHLVTVHDEVAAALNRGGFYGDGVQLEIPAPPLQGTETIVPLTRVEDFYKEGREQANCVATYAARGAASASGVHGGRPSSYVYRVLSPERATLSISRRGSRWVIDELRCAGNAPASSETVAAVKEWMEGRERGSLVESDREPVMGWEETFAEECDEACLVRF